MGLRKWLAEKLAGKEVEPKVKYVLKRMTEKGGMTKVIELGKPTSVEEVYPHLEAGFYALDVYRAGQQGFDRLWGPVEVVGEEAAKPAVSPRRGSAFGRIGEIAKEVGAIKEEGKELLGTLQELFGEKSFTVKDFAGFMSEAKEEWESLNKMFGTTTTKDQDIKVSGTIPAAVVYAPQLIDQSLDAVEKRMTRWGFLGPGGRGTAPPGAGTLKLPPKPSAVSEVEKAEKKVEETRLKLPEKPKVEAEKKEEKEEVESGEAG